jgi:hypothetical protein
MVNLQRVVRKSLCLAAFMLLFGCGSSNEAIDIQSLIVGKQFKIASRSENGGTSNLPDCAKDDTLELKTTGAFNSLIGGTQCNPNETDVVDGQYRFSVDKKVITFSAFGFDYTGKVIDASATRVIIEFDLGPGFIIRDTFIPKT